MKATDIHGSTLLLLSVGLCMSVAPCFAQDFPATHLHTKGSCQGMIGITANGISYNETAPVREPQPGDKVKKPHKWTWSFADIQQLAISPDSMEITAYEDRVWMTAAERYTRFTGDFARAYLRLKDRMDQRLIARLADEQVQPLWTIPVKQLGRTKGTAGELVVAGDRIVYKTQAKDASRTWRYSDIQGITSPGPFQLTFATNERAFGRYGAKKDFQFQLGKALTKEQLDNLTRRVDPHN